MKNYSIDETCAIIGIGRTKLYQLLKSGELEARKIGKRTVISQEDLEKFLSGLKPYPSTSNVV